MSPHGTKLFFFELFHQESIWKHVPGEKEQSAQDKQRLERGN